MSTKWSDPSCTVCCIMTDSTVLVVCTLASMPVRYPDWLETNAECLTCKYGEAWLALQLVMERWMPWSVKHGVTLWSTSRHCYTGSTFFSELHQLGYRWHCVSSLSLMILHTSFLAFHCTSASAYTRNKVTINMALTCMIFYMWRHT